MNFIEYLESLNFDAKSIAEIEKHVIVHASSFKEDSDIINKIEIIFKVFKMCGCSEEQIENIIVANKRMLSLSEHDIISIGCFLDKSGIASDIEREYRLRIPQLGRSYLRLCYLNNGIRNIKGGAISYNSFLMGDVDFQKDYEGHINGNVFEPTYDNLLSLYIKGNTKEEKEQYLSKIIALESYKWYRDKVLKGQKNYGNK